MVLCFALHAFFALSLADGQALRSAEGGRVLQLNASNATSATVSPSRAATSTSSVSANVSVSWNATQNATASLGASASFSSNATASALFSSNATASALFSSNATATATISYTSNATTSFSSNATLSSSPSATALPSATPSASVSGGAGGSTPTPSTSWVASGTVPNVTLSATPNATTAGSGGATLNATATTSSSPIFNATAGGNATGNASFGASSTPTASCSNGTARSASPTATYLAGPGGNTTTNSSSPSGGGSTTLSGSASGTGAVTATRTPNPVGSPSSVSPSLAGSSSGTGAGSATMTATMTGTSSGSLPASRSATRTPTHSVGFYSLSATNSQTVAPTPILPLALLFSLLFSGPQANGAAISASFPALRCAVAALIGYNLDGNSVLIVSLADYGGGYEYDFVAADNWWIDCYASIDGGDDDRRMLQLQEQQQPAREGPGGERPRLPLPRPLSAHRRQLHLALGGQTSGVEVEFDIQISAPSQPVFSPNGTLLIGQAQDLPSQAAYVSLLNSSLTSELLQLRQVGGGPASSADAVAELAPFYANVSSFLNVSVDQLEMGVAPGSVAPSVVNATLYVTPHPAPDFGALAGALLGAFLGSFLLLGLAFWHVRTVRKTRPPPKKLASGRVGSGGGGANSAGLTSPRPVGSGAVTRIGGGGGNATRGTAAYLNPAFASQRNLARAGHRAQVSALYGAKPAPSAQQSAPRQQASHKHVFDPSATAGGTGAEGGE